MKPNETEIMNNFDELISLIRTHITGERQNQLLALYDDLSERIATAPASSINTFHGCYAGGYVKHVLGVIYMSLGVYDMWMANGAYMEDYTKEELVFAAINHDLGKIGDMNHDYYIPNTSDWHVKNQGKVYVINPLIVNMSVPDRGIWLLQNYGISLSQNEFLAIKLHDGPYVEENKPYFTAWGEEKKIRSNIVFVLHQGDFMAARIEYETERQERRQSPISHTRPKPVNKSIKSTLSAGQELQDANSLFAKMFDTPKTEK